jgi:hypothetical protein
VNEAGVKDGLAAMGELIRNSVPDWVDAMRKRWPLAVALILFVIGLCLVLNWRNVSGAPTILLRVEAVTAGVLAICVFADAMRLVDAAYRITYGRLLHLLWITVYIGVIFCGAAIPYLVLNALHQSTSAYLLLFIAETVVGSRLCFAYYLSERKERPVLVSFLLTGGSTFVPSIVLAAATSVPRYALNWIIPTTHIPGLVEGAIVQVTAYMVLQFLSTTWQYPITVRWLAVCERLHPEIDPTAYAALPDPDANLV